MASTIGLKIANGEFYSIVEENSRVKKRLILTTVHDKQRSVQIDLYRSYTRTMADALYIGSLVVENIKPRPKGEPSIELIIASTVNGEITADAVDLDTSVKGEHQTLKVSLKSLDEDSREYEIPDFELEQNASPPTMLTRKDSLKLQSDDDEDENRRKFPWLIVICAALVLVAIVLIIWLFFFQGKPHSSSATTTQTTQAAPQPVQPAPQPAPAVKPEPAVQPEPVKAAEPVRAAEPVPVIQAPAAPPPVAAAPVARKRPPAPVSSYKVPSVIKRRRTLQNTLGRHALGHLRGFLPEPLALPPHSPL